MARTTPDARGGERNPGHRSPRRRAASASRRAAAQKPAEAMGSMATMVIVGCDNYPAVGKALAMDELEPDALPEDEAPTHAGASTDDVREGEFESGDEDEALAAAA